ncbi:hypothetical protein ANN_08407 [Periplaneta americana]|uniref:Uncharacterized protein n=1 Tax=Periplaneta americana TaxID=6978 RepID=A0ABQ8T2R1_PERAM|nr:hypothetical protein ANN_08407 [Periplaneta americana]
MSESENSDIENVAEAALSILIPQKSTDAGANISTLKRHGGWHSTFAAEGYVENSMENKKEIANLILRKKELAAEKEKQ